MKRVGLFFLSLIFMIAFSNVANAVNNNVFEFENNSNNAIEILKMCKVIDCSDNDSVKSQVIGSQEFNTPTPLDEAQAKKINVFPNPCVYSLKISGVNKGDQIYIYNSIGQIMTNLIADSHEVLIDVRGFIHGLYVVAIINGKKIDKINFMK